LALALICIAGLTAVVTVFLSSAAGQRVDETALRGARIGRGHLIDGALTVLGLISVVGLVVATGTVAVIAFSRRRIDLALAAVVLVGGANATTQVLKYRVLERPDVGIDTLTLNSLPSGHSTVAASLAVALVLVVPRRLRGPAALFGVITATLTGVATLAAGWHRPSDVVAALLVVGAWLGIVTTGLGLFQVRSEPTPGTRPRLPMTAVLLVIAGVVALAMAGLALWQTLRLDAIARDRVDLLLAYGGGAAAIAGCAAVLVAVAVAVAPDDPVRTMPDLSASRPAPVP
jgi:membrane-associated phospholipid phosphatase